MEGGEFGRGEFEILARAVEMQRSLLSQHVVGDALENVRDSVDSLWGLLQHIDAALTESSQVTVVHAHVLQESAARMADSGAAAVRDVEAVLSKLELLHADLRPLLNLALQVKQLRAQLQQLEPLIAAPPR